MRKIYLHLGYHKTATTFLQRSIFPKMKNVNYIRQKYIQKDLRRIRVNKLSDLKIENIRDYFNSFNNRKPMLISYEGFSGSPFAPRKSKTQSSILKDLRRIFPASDYDVSVIVGIREQVELLTSLYVQHVHQGGIMDAKHFIKYCKNNGSLRNFHYQIYLKGIEEGFGKDNLYLMIYEDFKQNESKEMLKLLNYMGEPEIPQYEREGNVRKANKSYGTMQVAIGRKLNRFFKTPIHPKGRLAMFNIPNRNRLPTRFLLQSKFSYGLHYKKYKFPMNLQESLKQRYAKGNNELAQRYSLQLPGTYFK